MKPEEIKKEIREELRIVEELCRELYNNAYPFLNRFGQFETRSELYNEINRRIKAILYD